MAAPQEADTQELHPLLRSGKRYLSVKEFASIFEMSEKWVYRQVDEGKIGAGRIGRQIRIPRTEAVRLDAELRQQVAESKQVALAASRSR